jgi:hypothetical protein
MRHVHNRVSKNFLIMAIFSPMVLLAYLGAQTMPVQRESNAYQESVSTHTIVEEIVPIESTTTLTTSLEETTTTTVLETTTSSIPVVKKPTTTKAYVPTTLEVEVSGGSGPPRNTSTLVGCIAFYESTWGEDPNVFQFTLGTWQAYGGKGSPSAASYEYQEQIFWKAWEDDGYHHWAAQKGRCF